jgi:hypothetical protein
MALSKDDIQNIAAVVAATMKGGGNGKGGTRDAFFISVESTIAPGASDIQRVTLDVDADFLIVTAVGDARDNANKATKVADPGIMVSLSQSQSGRSLQNIPIQWNNLLGTAQLNAPWPAPKHMAAGTTLSVTQTSIVPGGGLTLIGRITFWGFKIFGG